MTESHTVIIAPSNGDFPSPLEFGLEKIVKEPVKVSGTFSFLIKK